MQLEGATELERRIYETCLRVEREMPASDLETAVVVTLSDAGEQLQRLRNGVRDVLRAVAHAVGSWDGDATPAFVLEEVADRLGITGFVV